MEWKVDLELGGGGGLALYMNEVWWYWRKEEADCRTEGCSAAWIGDSVATLMILILSAWADVKKSMYCS